MSQGPACPGEPCLGKGSFGDPLLCVPSPSTGTGCGVREEPSQPHLHISKITVQAISRRSHWDAAPFPPGCPGTAALLSREMGILWVGSAVGDLKALVTCLGSPGTQQSSRAHCTQVLLDTMATGLYEGTMLISSPSAQGQHTPPPQDTEPALLLPQLPGKAPSTAGPGRKKICTDRKISCLER